MAGTFGGMDPHGLGSNDRKSMNNDSYYNNKDSSYKASNSITMNNDNVGMMSFNPNPGIMGSGQNHNSSTSKDPPPMSFGGANLLEKIDEQNSS